MSDGFQVLAIKAFFVLLLWVVSGIIGDAIALFVRWIVEKRKI